MSESPSATPGSHTATEQWQSFEMRMRRRRADRCLLRAEAALDADFLDDAQQAVEEAAGLTPDDPAVSRLLARLAEARLHLDLRLHLPEVPVDVPLRDRVPGDLPSTPAVERGPAPLPVDQVQAETPGPEGRQRPEAKETKATRWAFVAAAAMALVLAGSGAVAWYWTHAGQIARPQLTSSIAPRESESSGNRSGSLPAAASAAQQPGPDAPPDISTDSVDVVSTEVTAATIGRDRESLAREPEASEPLKPEDAPAVARSAEVSSRPRDAGEPAAAPVSPRIVESTPAPQPVAPPNVQPALSLPEPVSLAEAPLLAVADIPAPRGPAPSPTLPAASAREESAPAGAAAVDREQLVRAALTRYENAYSTLNASAASAVWPSVDRRALARAFEDLSSQTVTLGRCAVRVTGEAAEADCSGNASWTPKVGGGTQRATRRWRFELKQNGNDWLIVRAAVR